MGNGIAHVMALAGFEVTLADISQISLDKGLVNISNNLNRQLKKEIITKSQKEDTIRRISPSTNTEDLKDCDLVIEAVSENFQTKSTIFKELDQITSESCLLATNTSSISITKLASVTKRPDKVIGMHFMNPVPIMKLIEVIKGYITSENTVKTILDIAEEIHKTPVIVNDYPGFIANRILMPMINESIITLQEGVSGVKEIDTIMKLGMAHPMGPLQLADYIVLDVCHSILSVMHEEFGSPKYAPCALLTNMVNAGKLGRKTGEGFYIWTTESPELIVSNQFLK